MHFVITNGSAHPSLKPDLNPIRIPSTLRNSWAKFSQYPASLPAAHTLLRAHAAFVHFLVLFNLTLTAKVAFESPNRHIANSNSTKQVLVKHISKKKTKFLSSTEHSAPCDTVGIPEFLPAPKCGTVSRSET